MRFKRQDTHRNNSDRICTPQLAPVLRSANVPSGITFQVIKKHRAHSNDGPLMDVLPPSSVCKPGIGVLSYFGKPSPWRGKQKNKMGGLDDDDDDQMIYYFRLHILP